MITNSIYQIIDESDKALEDYDEEWEFKKRILKCYGHEEQVNF